MPETISSLRSLDNFPEFFLIAAITRAQKESGTELPVMPIEVILTVNGVELPYTETMDDVWIRSQAEFDKKVLEKAKELISDARLEAVLDVIEDARSMIFSALEKASTKADKE